MEDNMPKETRIKELLVSRKKPALEDYFPGKENVEDVPPKPVADPNQGTLPLFDLKSK